VNWVKVSKETEWIYFGAGSEVNDAIAIQKITEYFPDSMLVVATDRKHSAVISTDDLKSLLVGILGVKDFFIWDKAFKNVMEFSHIGVMRQGYI
jgi:hypothetical protein